MTASYIGRYVAIHVLIQVFNQLVKKMTYKIEQIVLENEKAFCIETEKGWFECYEIGATHSVRKATISGRGLDYVKEKHFVPRWGQPTLTDKTL